MTPKPGDTIVVWFSNGAASAVALKETLRLYGDICAVRAVNNPVAEEDEDNLRFQKDVEAWTGIKIEMCFNPKYPNGKATEVWQAVKAMSFPNGAPCTRILKIEARQYWEQSNHADWHVFGFTLDEKKRHDKFVLTERSNVLPVLIDAGITKDRCYEIVTKAGLLLPQVYFLGYPNANCLGCVKATSPTYWNHVRKVHPQVFAERAAQSKALGARLVRYRGERIFLDQLPLNAVGRPMKQMRAECGIVCEEWSPKVVSKPPLQIVLERVLYDEW